MPTLILYVILTSPPQWYQSEGVACSHAQKAGVPIFILNTFGGIAKDGRGMDSIVLDERDTDLKRGTCHEVEFKIDKQIIKVLRFKADD